MYVRNPLEEEPAYPLPLPRVVGSQYELQAKFAAASENPFCQAWLAKNWRQSYTWDPKAPKRREGYESPETIVNHVFSAYDKRVRDIDDLISYANRVKEARKQMAARILLSVPETGVGVVFSTSPMDYKRLMKMGKQSAELQKARFVKVYSNNTTEVEYYRIHTREGTLYGAGSPAICLVLAMVKREHGPEGLLAQTGMGLKAVSLGTVPLEKCEANEHAGGRNRDYAAFRAEIEAFFPLLHTKPGIVAPLRKLFGTVSAVAFLARMKGTPVALATDGSSAAWCPHPSTIAAPTPVPVWQEPFSVVALNANEALSWSTSTAVWLKNAVDVSGVPKFLARYSNKAPVIRAELSKEDVAILRTTKPTGSAGKYSQMLVHPDAVYFKWVPDGAPPSDFPVRRLSAQVRADAVTAEAILSRTVEAPVYFMERVYRGLQFFEEPPSFAVCPGEHVTNVDAQGKSTVSMVYISVMSSGDARYVVANGDLGLDDKGVAVWPFDVGTVRATALGKAPKGTFTGAMLAKRLHWLQFFYVGALALTGYSTISDGSRTIKLPRQVAPKEGPIDRAAAIKLAAAYPNEAVPALKISTEGTNSGSQVDPFARKTLLIQGSAEALAVVYPVVPTDDNRYGLNGVHWQTFEGQSLLAATDGSRLAVARVQTPPPAIWSARRSGLAGTENMHPVLLPRAICALGTDVAIAVTTFDAPEKDTPVPWVLAGEEMAYAQRSEQGEFPPWHKILPNDWKKPAPTSSLWHWNVEQALDVMTRATKTAGDKAFTVKIDPSGRISTRNLETGAWEDKLPGQKRPPEGKDAFSIGVNGSFWVDALQAFKDAGVVSFRFFLEAALSPIVLLPDEKTLVFAYVLMPIRLE